MLGKGEKRLVAAYSAAHFAVDLCCAMLVLPAARAAGSTSIAQHRSTAKCAAEYAATSLFSPFPSIAHLRYPYIYNAIIPEKVAPHSKCFHPY